MSRQPIRAEIRTRPEEPPEEGAALRERVREALSHWASGVAVLAVRDDDEVDAVTVSSFTSVSLDPPLVLACVHEQASLLPALRETGRFAVSVLPEDARRVASAVAGRLPLGDLPFAAEGDPVLAGALASFACRLHEMHAGGDHRIVVGAVERVELGPDPGARPLLWYRRDYRALRDGR